ncbi:MAG: exodeoxyribonuclease large subunit, partial [Baekduia sp.]|nr:exodeoxyribonuclease large subunit [Baekduia sp.]
MSVQPRPDGIAGSSLAGPFPVGAYAEKLRDELRKRARVQLFGEVWNFRASKA